MPATLKGHVNLSSKLSQVAQSAFVLDDLKTGTLISLAQLCDDDCIAIFSKFHVKILKNNEVIIQGKRMDNGLWSIPLNKQHQINGILRTDKPKKELAEYIHASLGSPTHSTLIKAINKGHLTTIPGLTSKLISKHLPKNIATSLGHQDQEHKGLRSTKNIAESPESDLEPTLEDKSYELAAMLMSEDNILKSYSDQTGKFPIPSSRGNKYIFILYNRDTNSIHAEAIPNRQANSIKSAWEKVHSSLKLQGHAPTLHILDNECSNDLKQAFAKYNVDFQRVPPKEHRANASERAIRTFKNHFISILCSIDSKFPMNEWDRLLPQSILTLNLLRSSRIHPSLSAHASIFGQYDFNKTPIAPPGTKIVAHTAAEGRPTFGQHGKVGWYIGPSPEHYRCYKCYFPDTMSERDVLKVDFFPEKTPFPSITSADYLKQTAEDLLQLLSPTAPSHNNPLEFGSPILNAFRDVATILGRAISPPQPPAATPLPIPTLQQPCPPHTNLPLSQSPRVAPPRVHIPKLHIAPPPIRAAKPSQHHKAHLPPINRRFSPAQMRFCRLPQRLQQRFNHRQSHFTYPHLHQHYAQSVQHDPSISGKIHNSATGKAETIDSLLAGNNATTWTKSLSNEWGRLGQGLHKQRQQNDSIKGNNTIYFIKPREVPKDRKVTYANFVCTMRPEKSETHRVRITVGGDRLDAYQDVRSPAVGITDTKLHLNSTISDAKNGARYSTADLKDFFLGSKMKIFQYMRVHRKYITQEVMDEYGLTDEHFDSRGYAYIKIQKGMYGLKEASILAYDELKTHLKLHGYSPVKITPGLWTHDTRKTTFTLAVDDFGIKHFNKEDREHLFQALRKKYTITTDTTGSSYLGLTLDWNYTKGYVDVSMPGYVAKARTKFDHPDPKMPQHAPHRWVKPKYGQKIQFAQHDTSPLLDKKGIKRVQSVSGTFLYYGRAVDPTILPALNEISNNQATPTLITGQACDQLLDYLATHPDATIRYYASDMILYIVSDAAYLVLPKARSRCAGFFYLSDFPATHPPKPKANGAVHVLCKTLRSVPASAAEAETGGLFLSAQEAVPIITSLQEMGHPQPPNGNPLETDNTTAHDILHAKVRMKRSKAFDMRYHWLKDRIAQTQFNLYWAKGRNNQADYFTKHYPPSYHKLMRSIYLQKQAQINILTSQLRGCVTPIGLDRPFTSMTSVV